MTDDFVRGVKAAAAVVESYNESSTHDYRLDDCVLFKLNVTRRAKPRRNKVRSEDPARALTRGFFTALAEMYRCTHDAGAVLFVARNAALSMMDARAAAVDSFDLRSLRQAGLK